MYEKPTEKSAAKASMAPQLRPERGAESVQRAEASAETSAPVASKGIATVRQALIAHFRDAFVPSSAFQETFGGKSWADIEGEVLSDVAGFGLDPSAEIYRDPDGTTTYTGRIWSLYTEVTVAPGAEPSVYVELD